MTGRDDLLVILQRWKSLARARSKPAKPRIMQRGSRWVALVFQPQAAMLIYDSFADLRDDLGAKR